MLDLLFETSWEVCNKVGGIYAVLSTKANTLQQQYKDKVIFIGPDVWTEEKPSPYFEESKSLLRSWRAQSQLPEGVTVRIGRWNVPGRPIAILVKFDAMYAQKDTLYAQMWERYGVDSLHAYGDYDEACAFACASALVIESIVAFKGDKARRVVAHFDEWTTGMGLLHVRMTMPHIATVFTTHATSIGRSICGNGKPLYDYMKGYNGDQMAAELNMESKHSLEKAAAHAAHVFTTVSEVTARECEQLLECRPMVTPNAFEGDFVPRGIALTNTRRLARKRLMNVAQALTGINYSPDSLIVATSGRCEVRNKGIDVFLDGMNVALSTLNEANADRHVLAFILVPSWTDGPRPDLQNALRNGTTFGLPCDTITHHIHDGYTDAVEEKMRQLGINNLQNDRLHIFYVPCYLDGNDGIIDMPYYDVLPAADLTIFPSYYEPWGYTPLESVAFGVPTITTDLAGFGQWVLSSLGDNVDATGVKVIHRDDSNYHDTVHAIAASVLGCFGEDASRLAKWRKAAKKTAEKASWQHFITHYSDVYQKALDQVRGEQKLDN